MALVLGQSAAEGSMKDYVVSGSKDGTVGVFQVADGTLTYKHKCGKGISMLAVFDPTPGASALLLIGYEVRYGWCCGYEEVMGVMSRVGRVKICPVHSFATASNTGAIRAYFVLLFCETERNTHNNLCVCTVFFSPRTYFVWKIPRIG